MNTSASPQVLAPFVFDGNRSNAEQVRPYQAGYKAVLAEIEASGKFPYNDSFKGRIPGMDTSANEDTGIYMLQVLRDIDAKQALIEEFIASGGVRVETIDFSNGTAMKGTLARHGWYMGGTGWDTTEIVRLTVEDGTRVVFKEPKQRAWRTHHGSVGQYLFRPAT